jgi:hypothetical protein
MKILGLSLLEGVELYANAKRINAYVRNDSIWNQIASCKDDNDKAPIFRDAAKLMYDTFIIYE